MQHCAGAKNVHNFSLKSARNRQAARCTITH